MAETAERRRASPGHVGRRALGHRAGRELRPGPRSAGGRWASRRAAAISVYAQGDDYHELIKGRLKALARWLQGRFGGELKVFVDTAPLMEKPLAERAGLGWQGKHTNLVSREFGSWLFLGSILTTLELPPDRARADDLRHLPRLPGRLPDQGLPGALPARCAALHLLPDHRARRARSRANSARRSATASTAATTAWPSAPGTSSRARARSRSLHAREALKRARAGRARRASTTPAFRALFAKSPVKRIGRDRFVRNVLYAIGNSGDPAWRRRPSGCWTIRRLWCAARRSGRCAGCWTRRRSRRRRAARKAIRWSSRMVITYHPLSAEG